MQVFELVVGDRFIYRAVEYTVKALFDDGPTFRIVVTDEWEEQHVLVLGAFDTVQMSP